MLLVGLSSTQFSVSYFCTTSSSLQLATHWPQLNLDRQKIESEVIWKGGYLGYPFPPPIIKSVRFRFHSKGQSHTRTDAAAAAATTKRRPWAVIELNLYFIDPPDTSSSILQNMPSGSFVSLSVRFVYTSMLNSIERVVDNKWRLLDKYQAYFPCSMWPENPMGIVSSQFQGRGVRIMIIKCIVLVLCTPHLACHLNHPERRCLPNDHLILLKRNNR